MNNQQGGPQDPPPHVTTGGRTTGQQHSKMQRNQGICLVDEDVEPIKAGHVRFTQSRVIDRQPIKRQ